MPTSTLHKTPFYKLKAAYRHIKITAQKQNSSLPFSEKEFVAWAMPLREAFITQNPGKRPSFRRIDDLKEYTFENMHCIGQNDKYISKQHRIIDGQKWCRACKTMKSLDHFTKRTSSSCGYAHECRECIAERVKIRNATPEYKEIRRLQRRAAAQGQNNGRALFTDEQVFEYRKHAQTLDYKDYFAYCRSLVSEHISLRAVQNMLRGTNYNHLPGGIIPPQPPKAPSRPRFKKPSAITSKPYDDRVIIRTVKPSTPKPVFQAFDPKKTGVVKLYKARGWSPVKVARLLNVRERDIVAVW